MLGAALLVGCTSSGGSRHDSATITGRLGVSGAPFGLTYITGSVTVQTFDRRTVRTVTTDGKGRFTVRVAPGRYQLTGQSPRNLWPTGSCRAYNATTAVAHTTTAVNVVCIGQ